MGSLNYRAGLGLGFAAAVLILGFQNCGPSFTALNSSTKLASLSEIGTNAVPVQVKDANGQSIPNNASLTVAAPYKVSISGVQLPSDAVIKWNAVVTSSGGGVAIHMTDPVKGDGDLQCDSPGSIAVSAQITSAGVSYSSSTYNYTCVAAAPPPPGATPPPPIVVSSTVEFRIPAGTGTGAWNTQATTVKVFVGQLLRIINDDTIPHRMHTGGAPCAHQNANMATGQSYDCVVSKPVSSQASTPVYDHNNNGKFWVDAFDGRQLYATNCQSCHGALATSEVRNRTSAQIKSAIVDINEMKNLKLSDDQVNAIAYSLSH